MRRTWLFAAFFFLLSSTVALAVANRSHTGWATAAAKPHRHVRVVRDRAVKIRTHRLHITRRLTSSHASLTGQAAGDPILFGDSTVESNRDSEAAGVGKAFAFSNATAGTTASISVYVDSSSAARKVYAGLYTDSNKHPASLVVSGSLSSPKSGSWNNVPLPSAVVSPGRTYWLAVLGTGGRLRFRDHATGTCVSEASSQTGLGSFSSTWKVGQQYGSCPISAYVNGHLIAAPSNTSMPAISGTTTQGQTLSTGNGTWSGSPTSYSYQWRQCDSAGTNCADISGATSNSYTFASGNVGHTIRSVVTATNAGGSTPATSAATAAVSPQQVAPTAAFTDSPASPVTGQAAHFDASGSKCYAAPCTYSWADSPPSAGSWPLGTGQTLDFTFQQTATKYIRLTVTDANNQTATIEHDVAVGQAAQAPANTQPPNVTGPTQQSQILTTSNGSWSNSPTAYSYQWQDCDSSGNNCTNISGATGNTYTLANGDVGETIRAVVKATNASGSTSATAPQSAVVVASSGPQKNCVNNPSACGYPDATNSGLPAGTALTTKTGNISANTPGQTISNIDLTNGTIVVTANNVTIKNSRITTGSGQLNGVSAIDVKSGVTGTVVEDTTMQGSNCTTGALFAGVMNEGGDQLTMLRDYGVCLDDILHGSGTLKDSYSLDNASIPNDHYEPVADDGGNGSLTIIHNTLLNPHDQTAAVFTQCTFGNVTSLDIEDNLAGGGDFVFYGPLSDPCSNGGGTETVKNNRITRLYYPTGGQYGVGVYFPSNVTWSGNYWDDTLLAAAQS